LRRRETLRIRNSGPNVFFNAIALRLDLIDCEPRVPLA